MNKNKVTYTKIYMTLLGLLYFTGAIIGGWLCFQAAFLDIGGARPIDSSMFVAYATYLGGPTSIAIGFYAWKSKAENILKIKSSLERESETVSELNDSNKQVLATIANMRGEYI